MTTIVHISDTHFGTEVPAVVEAITRTISTLEPDILILSGDITQRASKTQFKAAADFMASLPAKTKLVIPGNHDIPLYNIFARILMPYANYKNAFGIRHRVFYTAGVGILCYDATSPFRHTRGKLSQKIVMRNITSLKQQMKPSDILIACAHQPLVTALEVDADETLIGRDHTAQLWSGNQVDIALSGHVHMPLYTTTRGAFPKLPRHFILAGAGTAVSHRTRSGAPNSFNMIALQKDGKALNIVPYVFNATASEFAADARLFFVKSERGWQQVKQD